MRILRPTLLTPRSLGAAAILAAVFASGWYLGQPLRPAVCEAPVVLGPNGLPEPLRYSDHFEAVSCDPTDYEPRILAWLTGDFQ